MVDVQMGENHPLDVARAEAEGAQLRTDSLFAVDAKCYLPADELMQLGLAGFEQMRALPGVDDDDAFGTIDQPCIGAYPVGPVRIGETSKPPRTGRGRVLDLLVV